MKKCSECRYYKVKIKCLACEQEADASSLIIRPQIIKPMVKNVPLEELSDREKAAVILNIVGEMTFYRISQLPKMNHKTIKSLVVKGLQKMRRKKNG